MFDVRISSEPIRAEGLIRAFSEAVPASGAQCSFVGKVRADHAVHALELSYYEPMTLRGMEQLALQASNRFGLLRLLMVHRIGKMAVGETIVCVAASAAHRRAVFDAVDFCMDHLKSAAWFWKREKRADGWHWIEPSEADYSALKRWS